MGKSKQTKPVTTEQERVENAAWVERQIDEWLLEERERVRRAAGLKEPEPTPLAAG